MSSAVVLARPLLPLERRTLARLARGFTYEQIQKREATSHTAVINAVSGLHRLLGARSSAHAVALAHELGLLERERYALRLGAEDLDLLRMIADGLPNREIAVRLGRDLPTVGNLVSALYRLMGATNRPHAVHIGYCAGILGGGS